MFGLGGSRKGHVERMVISSAAGVVKDISRPDDGKEPCRAPFRYSTAKYKMPQVVEFRERWEGVDSGGVVVVVV